MTKNFHGIRVLSIGMSDMNREDVVAELGCHYMGEMLQLSAHSVQYM